MKVTKNEEHNSIEIDFGGAKPSEQVRELMKAYGFWWFGKGKVWCHTLDVDGEFFEKFVDERIKPLVAAATVEPTVEAVAAAAKAMSDEDKQALLAALMAK